MIIELSQFNAQSVARNGEWDNQFPPITVKTGDTIAIKEAVIDAQLSGAYNNICIDKDTIISLAFGFYYIFSWTYPEEEFFNFTPYANSFDFIGSYAFATYTSLNTVVERRRQIFIPKGNYTGQALTNIMNTQLSLIGTNSYNLALQTPGFPLANSLTASFDLVCDEILYNGGDFYINSVNVSNQLSPEASEAFFGNVPATGFTLNVTFFEFDARGNSNTQKDTPLVITIESYDATTRTLVFTPAYQHSRSYLEDREVQFFGNINIVKTGFTGNALSFRFPDDSTNSFTTASARFMGASQFAFGYDPQSNRFSVEQIHTPLIDSKANQVVALENNQNDDLRSIPNATGIYFTTNSSLDFLKQLGFDNSLFLQVNDGVFAPNQKFQVGINTTGGLIGVDAYLSYDREKLSYLDASKAESTTIITSETFPIQATKNYSFAANSGHVLVEIIGNITTTYTSNERTFKTILAVGSKDYSSTGFITLYEDGSLEFVNEGEPFMLSSLRVRILDGLTKKVSPVLGSKNVVFLELLSNALKPR